MTETYGFSGSQGQTVLEGQRLVPRNRPSDTVFVFMHPASTLQLLPMPTALAAAGYHVLCCGSRYAKNDSALIMEKVVYDLGAYVRYAREELGYRKVVLVGWSGGGSLALFYQAQSEKPTITHTPAGDPYDLTAASLPQVDGVIFIAAHLSRAETLTEWLDRRLWTNSIPTGAMRNSTFTPRTVRTGRRFPRRSSNIFAPAARAQPADHRLGERYARLPEAAQRRGDGARVRGAPHDVRRALDRSRDRSQRPQTELVLSRRSEAVNVGPVGLARFSTLRSWLSQWSYDDSNAKGPKNAANIRHVPVLQIENLADDAVPATHNSIIREALATSDKEYVRIEGATHYYLNQPEQLQQCISALVSWSERKGFLPHGA